VPSGTKRIPSASRISAAWTILACFVIGCFALLHAANLTADFPNHTPWMHDWAKYTDEGWYGNAAVRAHLFGSWYLPHDFNPAVALPVWPFLEWLVFFATGVSIGAARGLAVLCFFATLGLTYLLARRTGSRGTALLALTLIVTSPFLYAFSRLAILEPLLTTLTLAALNVAARLNNIRRPTLASVGIGLLFTLMMLTKTTAIFLLPALGWAMLLPLWPGPQPGPNQSGPKQSSRAVRCALAAAVTFAIGYGSWMALVIQRGLLTDYKYLFYINNYRKPSGHIWILVSLWWSLHGGLWADHILVPLAGLLSVGALVAWRTKWGRCLIADPVFGASALAVVGYILFMTVQNHPQPRYFAVVAVFCIVLVAQGVATLLHQASQTRQFWVRQLAWGAAGLAGAAAVLNAAWTLSYALHPEFTFIEATQSLARYIDEHPNGNRLLVGTSGDQITLMAHVPSLCDDFGTIPLHEKVGIYRPGWFVTWNDLDPGALADLHTHFSLEQAATFHALDDPQRQRLVLFKLHPWPGGLVRDQVDENLKIQLPEDKFDPDLMQ
jgi:hypothetical protein